MNWLLFRELRFRRPMAVTEVVLFARNTYPYPRCPRCRRTMEREYMSYCDRCGQKLDWTHFEEKALVISK